MHMHTSLKTVALHVPKPQRRYEIINIIIPRDFCAYQPVSLWVCPVAVLKLKNGGILNGSLAQPL